MASTKKAPSKKKAVAKSKSKNSCPKSTSPASTASSRRSSRKTSPVKPYSDDSCSKASPPSQKGKRGQVNLLDSDEESESDERVLNLYFGGVLFNEKYYVPASATIRTKNKTVKTNSVSKDI